ncbi:MAG TPA: hypothetical protein VFV99_20220 [Kofleriaceae bacterium]|nr:hypothetical protein [Kofleriaceae bacterium]
MKMRHCLLGLVVATPAFARPGDGVTEEDLIPKSEIRDSVEHGELMPWSVAARHVRLGMLVNTYGGWDAAKDAPVMTGTLEASLFERLTLRASATNPGMTDVLRPSFGALFELTHEEDSGIDLAVGGDYELEGWNHNPALVTRVAAARTAGLTRLQANAAFGLATNSSSERYGDLRLSGLHPIAEGLYAGLDSRARLDLERSGEEPTGELDWDMQAGPVATLALGRWAVSATGGVSAWKLRSRDEAKVGAIGAVGVGAVF